MADTPDHPSLADTLYEGKTAIQILNEQVVDCQWRLESEVDRCEKHLAALREQVQQFKLAPLSTNTPLPPAGLTKIAAEIDALLFALQALDSAYYSMVKGI